MKSIAALALGAAALIGLAPDPMATPRSRPVRRRRRPEGKVEIMAIYFTEPRRATFISPAGPMSKRRRRRLRARAKTASA